jgi:predicted PurR-regulated permease PerM
VPVATDSNLSLASAEPDFEHSVASPSLGGTRRDRGRRPHRERIALGILALAAVTVAIWLASPVAVGVFMGSLVAFTMEPFNEGLIARRFRPELAALTSVTVATLGVIAAAGAMGYLMVSRGVVIANDLLSSLGPDGSARTFIMRTTARFPRELSAEFLIAKLRDAAAELAARVGIIAGAVVNATFSALLGCVFMVLTIYFVLRHWKLLVRRAEELLPLHPRHTRVLLEEFRTAGRITLLGTVVTGLVQGALAAVGYWVLGVPEPAFLGAVTAVASLLPVVGTVLIWVPAGLYLIAMGEVGRGIFELAYGVVVVVGVSDYFIRPRLVGGEGSMPVLLTLIALFGGLELFGIVGLILGPVLMDLARATLRLYAAEKRKARPLVGRGG